MDKKNILIINSYKNVLSLFNVFKKMGNYNFSFSVCSTENEILTFAQQNNWPIQKMPIFFKTNLNSKVNFITTIFLPLYYLYSFFHLLVLKYRDQVDIIICCGLKEKIIYTPFGSWFKIKFIWLEYPEIKYNHNFTINFLKKLSAKSTLIVPMNYVKQNLINLGFKGDNLKLIRINSYLNFHRHQENIFSEIATSESKWPQRKFFTIGTVVDLRSKQNIEILFNAAKKIVDVIRFPQIIIIGDGEARKDLTWLAKKIGIDNFVWFVGEQDHLKKWLDSFDVFIVAAKTLYFEDLNNIINALASGLPVIGPLNLGLEEIIMDNSNGYLVEEGNSEDLAQKIIKLHQNKNLKILFGQQSKNLIEREFNIDQTIQQLCGLLNKQDAQI